MISISLVSFVHNAEMDLRTNECGRYRFRASAIAVLWMKPVQAWA